MSNQQNYRPVLRQLLEELVKQPDFAAIKGKIDKDMLAQATYEACAILREKTRIREQAQQGDAAMKLYLETYPTPTRPTSEEAEEFDPTLGMYVGIGDKQQEDDGDSPFIIPGEFGGAAGVKESNDDEPFFIPDSGDDDFDVITYE